MNTTQSLRQILEAMAALEQRVAMLEDKLAQLGGGAATAESVESKLSDVVNERMLGVIRLVAQGDTDNAQRELRSIPEEELSAQPAVVAIVAAALCAQKGELSQAMRALERAKTLTDDPRLLKVMQHLQDQMA